MRTITTRLAVDGETAFKRAMTEADASLRAIKSELQLSETQFQEQAGSVEALTGTTEQNSRAALEAAQAEKETAQGLIDGLTSKEEAFYARVRDIAARMNQILDEAKIPCRTTLWRIWRN